jgi:sugar O-acyltransferase (sialic acid O-acetyltransferase NeuD family)
MERFAIYGCGGFGREILPIVRGLLPSVGNPVGVVFVSDVDEEVGRIENGVEVITFDRLVSAEHRDRKVIVSQGSPSVRRRLTEKCEAERLQFRSIAASTYKSLDDVTVGEGSVFCDFSMCTSNVKIGRQFQCNIYSYVAHDCVIGDFVTFAPRVNCNGRIVIEDDVYVGTSAVLRQGDPDRPLRIGRGAVIGMGAVVTRDVEAYSTVIGNPAKPMARK